MNVIWITHTYSSYGNEAKNVNEKCSQFGSGRYLQVSYIVQVYYLTNQNLILGDTETAREVDIEKKNILEKRIRNDINL